MRDCCYDYALRFTFNRIGLWTSPSSLQLFELLRLSPTPRLVLLEARALADAHVPPFPSEFPVLLMGVDSPELASHVQDVLLTVYPREHEVIVVDGGKKKEERMGELGEGEFSASTCLFIPALTEGTAFESPRRSSHTSALPMAVRGTGANSPIPADAFAGRIL